MLITEYTAKCRSLNIVKRVYVALCWSETAKTEDINKQNSEAVKSKALPSDSKW